MDLEIANIVLGLAGAIIMLLLTIIGFFLKSLHTSIKLLESTVNELVTAIEVDKMRSESGANLCKEKHKQIDVRFADVDRRITKLETA